MFTTSIQLMFNNTVWYSVTRDVHSVLNKYLDQRMSKKQSSKICIVKTSENKMSIKRFFFMMKPWPGIKVNLCSLVLVKQDAINVQAKREFSLNF